MKGLTSITSRWRWLAGMAWRDSRGRRLLLLLFTSSVAFGVAAIVSVQGLRVNLERLMDEQTRTLLGADVILQSRVTPSSEVREFIATLPGEKVMEQRLRTMVRFPQSGESRFVELRAIDKPLPLYGKMETEPASATSGRLPATGQAIVEQSLLLEYDLTVGDSILLGSTEFVIEAALIRMAGESEVSGFFAPRIYINLPDLEGTGLVQPGSIIRHRTAIATEGPALQALLQALQEAELHRFPEAGIRVETVAERKERLNRVLGNLLDFLNLVSFTALLLGGIGILGAVQVYLSGKRDTVAVLRCLGAPAHLGTAIYGLQLGGFALLGALFGALLGAGVQFVIPLFLGDFLPFEITMRWSPGAIVSGFLYGWSVAAASTLLPLTHVSRVSPLQAIRSSVERGRAPLRDPLFIGAAGFLLLLLFGFALLQARHLWQALGFIGGIALVGGLLFGIGHGLRHLLRKAAPTVRSYSYRMALSNLYRPQNRTLILTVILGMGFLMVHTLLLIRGALLGQIGVDLTLDAPNVVLIDVQYDQKELLLEELERLGHPPREVMPVVMMRVDSIKDKPLEHWRSLEESPVSDWVHTWEFRNTYRDHILDNATLVAGEFVALHAGPEPYPVSLSENVIDDFGVGIGDFITWNVQGIPVRTVVSSIRKVNWQLGRQNFNVVFPLGTIEAAPVVFAISLNTAGRTATAALQRELGDGFPNVSLVDLSLVFESVRTILNKATFVIKFMAGFTIATGLLVLVGALLGTRYQRIRESVLLRTLGASRSFIRGMLSIEFILLGSVAGLSGLLLSWGVAALLLKFVFNLPIQNPDLSSLLLLAGMVFTTWIAGWFTSRGIATEPPLVVLRREV
jgi:putative ABC transport system permease protein